MAPKYTLTYYPPKGIAEPIRFLLSYGKADWKDVRFQLEEWPAIKATIPFGKVPTLEFDGKTIHQSLAICRYLAKQYQLIGDDDWDALQTDVAVDTIMDFRSLCTNYFVKKFFGEDVETLNKLKEPLIKESIPYYFTKFENLVKENKGYFVNGKLTWADIFWAAHSDSWEGALEENILAAYPNLQALQKKVFALPGIKEWIETRPKTDY